MSQLPPQLHTTTTSRTLLLSIFFTLSLSLASGQKVGINTESPQAGLHVVSNDGLLITSEFGSGVLPVTGLGTRMVWNPKTASFRVGRLTDDDGGIYADYWDFFNVGDYSIVSGVNSKATGYASSVFGVKNQGMGTSSFIAGGINNITHGYYSFASGLGNTAYSQSEFVVGTYATTYAADAVNAITSSDRLFVVGNGLQNETRHNALTILKNGNAGFGTDSPQSSLHVVGNTTIDHGRITFLNTGNSVFIGDLAGEHEDLDERENIFIGRRAGHQVTTGANNIAIGNDALISGYASNRNIAIGFQAISAGQQTGDENTAVGYQSMQNSSSSHNNVALGFFSMNGISGGSYNVALGNGALQLVDNGISNIAIGSEAMILSANDTANVSVGNNAGKLLNGNFNTILGNKAGRNANGNGNVLIGNEAGANAIGNNLLYIDNTDTDSPLIKGDFANRKIEINDSLQSKYFKLTNGAADGYFLQSNSTGNASWVSPSSVSVWTSNGNNAYNNNNGNIGIGVNNPLEKLHIEGNLRINTGRITMSNTTYTTFVGQEAGESDVPAAQTGNTFFGSRTGKYTTLGSENAAFGSFAFIENATGNRNVAIGKSAMERSKTGNSNTAIGYNALNNVINGSDNIAIGFYALNNYLSSSSIAIGNEAGNWNVNGAYNVFLGHQSGFNNLGSSNVFIGNEVGRNETGSEKLYIDCSSTSSPLIYGDFLTNKVTINDSLSSKYFQMTNGAGLNKIMVSDQSGRASWINPSNVFQSNWTVSGNHIYNSNSQNVGIGNNSPDEKLTVTGNVKINAGNLIFANTGESVFIGLNAGANDERDNNRNVFIGQSAGYANTSGKDNIALGQSSLVANTTGSDNVALSINALQSNITGSANIALGNYSLSDNQTGSFNIGLGQHALANNVAGEHNLVMGYFAGFSVKGNENTIIGHEAGMSTEGLGNVFLGYKSGAYEVGSNKLYISNSSTTAPLIYGDFSSKNVFVNDSLGTRNLKVLNGASITGDLEVHSGRIPITDMGHSIFIGEQAGALDDLTDNNNVFIGHHTGASNVNGTNNLAIGSFALQSANNSYYNIALGQNVMSGASISGQRNTGIGNFSLQAMTSGEDNLAIGQNAGGAITSGGHNISVGNNNSDALTTGTGNTSVGYEAMGENLSGSGNTIMGQFAGYSLAGNNNVIIGNNAGLATLGSANVMIGNEAGYGESGSNKLYIDNSGSSTPLIYGDFATNKVTINDSLTVKSELSVGTSVANSTFEVNGSVAAKFKTPLVAGTDQPDASAMVWRYNSGTGNIVLPTASTCPNRMYVIINQTMTPRTITNYRDLTTNVQNSLGSSVALWLMSDGSQWWQIK